LIDSHLFSCLLVRRSARIPRTGIAGVVIWAMSARTINWLSKNIIKIMLKRKPVLPKNAETLAGTEGPFPG
jgi:hypothetical protein